MTEHGEGGWRLEAVDGPTSRRRYLNVSFVLYNGTYALKTETQTCDAVTSSTPNGV